VTTGRTQEAVARNASCQRGNVGDEVNAALAELIERAEQEIDKY